MTPSHRVPKICKGIAFRLFQSTEHILNENLSGVKTEGFLCSVTNATLWFQFTNQTMYRRSCTCLQFIFYHKTKVKKKKKITWSLKKYNLNLFNICCSSQNKIFFFSIHFAVISLHSHDLSNHLVISLTPAERRSLCHSRWKVCNQSW